MSGFYVTKPWGRQDQNDFVNAAAEVETHLSAAGLLGAAKKVERGLGRLDRGKWGPREIDIDILLYGNQIIEEEGLVIPHPHMCERAFVLVPLVEIAPDLVHPGTGVKVKAHLQEMQKGGDPTWISPAT
jgi:2-amino-4-hydroxy-6-hydroxymethyldihydropteridine diphosphokinase